MDYKISYCCVSHTGKSRNINQDNFVCNTCFMETNEKNIKFPLSGVCSSKDSVVFGIFDGLGGEECGEVAAYIAAKNASVLQITKNVSQELLEFCNKTNEDICNYTTSHQLSSMGTTAALVAFTNKKITICNIGDSKIFRFHNKTLEQISQDHVMISTFGTKAPLLQNLGISPTEITIDPYLAEGLYQHNDIYLLCSDGLTDMVPTEDIAHTLFLQPIGAAIHTLLYKALANGGKDNISIILCKVEQQHSWFFKKWNR